MTAVVTFVLVILGPAAAWTGYLYVRDRHRPEPLRLVGLAYLLGIVAGVAALKSYDLLAALGVDFEIATAAERRPGAFLVWCIAVIGVVEELPKLLVFALVCTRFAHFDEEIDGIVYASMVALGFASYENWLFLEHLDRTEMYARALTSPLVHTIFASIWGYAIARARRRGTSVWTSGAVGLALAVVAHGSYDYLTLSPALASLSALIILALWIWRIAVMRRLHDGAVRLSAALCLPTSPPLAEPPPPTGEPDASLPS